MIQKVKAVKKALKKLVENRETLIFVLPK